MRKLFPTCLLIQDSSNTFGLKMTEVNLHPGNTFPPDQGKSIALAGGFSSITPESGFPLSSTLQLNYDLATFSTQDLEKIALAELGRVNRMNYRSYTVETDKRVGVIGDSAEELNKFIDTYGGLLEIEPLLLKGSHPDIPTVTALDLSGNGLGWRLDYQVRSPINFERCTYCGNCGPACPVQCISEKLFVNYDLCTFCKECEKVCAAQAIDMHSVLGRVLELPAVIILGNSRVDVPPGAGNVFYQDTLSEYFKTLFPYQLDEVITCSNALCQFSGNLDRGCDLCLPSCPHGAITQDVRGTTVDSLKCEECGACVAACPTGALQNERFDDASFIDYFRKVSLPEDGTVVIGDKEILHRLWWRQQGKRRQKIFYLQYDKVQSLSLFHFMFLLNNGTRRVVVLEGEGREGRLQGRSQAKKQRDLACDLLNRLYDQEDAVVSCCLENFDMLIAAPLTGSFGTGLQDDVFVNRRQFLFMSLESLVKKSGREVTIVPEESLPFATVSCNEELCTECMACINVCRIQAMQADQQQLTLNHLGTMCVGCGLCVRICPENALTISSEFTLNSAFFKPTVLARAEAMACKSCGKVFGTRKSFERVMAILAQKEKVDTSHFEYCDTCRVVKLFETE